MPTLTTFFQKERNKNLFLLIAMLLHNLIYPLSTAGNGLPILFYLIFSSMFVIGVYLLSKNRLARQMITVSGVAVFVVGLLNVYTPSDYTVFALYLVVIVYHVVMIIVLAQYVFQSEQVLLEVVLAATSLYLVLGSLYTPIYGLIELIEPNSFVIASGAELNWQRLLYYSYVTLTTVGYGDITPVKFYAQSFAAFEAITGVLYTVILLSRLVSLYQHETTVS
jgi:hypothetical protein